MNNVNTVLAVIALVLAVAGIIKPTYPLVHIAVILLAVGALVGK